MRAQHGPAAAGPSPGDRTALGRAARERSPRSGHSRPVGDEVDAVSLLARQARKFVPALVPVRHSRMLVSPFAYFKGSALAMAAYVAASPDTGLVAQLCGDATMANFGVFASLEGDVVFDLADFDETFPGPFEWDVKRLAASLEVAARDVGFDRQHRTEIVRSAVRSYREAVSEFAAMPMVDVWNSKLDLRALLPRLRGLLGSGSSASAWGKLEKASAQESHGPLSLMVEVVDGVPRIASNPPVVIPASVLGAELDSVPELKWLPAMITSYVNTLDPEVGHLLAGYRVAHVARAVIGVGGVGLDCWVVSLADDVAGSQILLQVKQARESVLEKFWPGYDSPGVARRGGGRRVVTGQRLVQAGSDAFLGWESDASHGHERDYYIRQVRDRLVSADSGRATASGMELWGRMCGWTLARAHSRSGDRVAIAAYLGTSDAFDRAIVKFARRYADQNERDHASFEKAARKGRIVVDRT